MAAMFSPAVSAMRTRFCPNLGHQKMFHLHMLLLGGCALGSMLAR